MSGRVLLVDDEPNLLEGIRRRLRGRYAIATATSGKEGLETIERESEPFEVVVSDMRMPEMDGVGFLSRVRRISPDSVRIVLSGQSDLDSAIAAVNQGRIFRFLTKPCETEVLIQTLDQAIEHRRLVLAERELLEKTLSGSTKLLTDLLSVVSPEAFSKSSRIQRYADAIVAGLELDDAWEFHVAALLSQIGCIVLPAETLAKLAAAEELSGEESEMFRTHPRTAAKLLSSIPRLERAGRMIAGQLDRPEGERTADPRTWERETLGAQILRAAIEFDFRMSKRMPRADAIAELAGPELGLHPALLEGLETVEIGSDRMEHRKLRVAELRTGMVLDEDAVSSNGLRIVPRGHELTATMLTRLRNFAGGVGIVEPIRVLVPR